MYAQLCIFNSVSVVVTAVEVLKCILHSAHYTHCAVVQLCAQSGALRAHMQRGNNGAPLSPKGPKEGNRRALLLWKTLWKSRLSALFLKISQPLRKEGANVCKVLWEWMAARKRRQVWPAVFFTKPLCWRIFQPTTELWFKIDILSLIESDEVF